MGFSLSFSLSIFLSFSLSRSLSLTLSLSLSLSSSHSCSRKPVAIVILSATLYFPSLSLSPSLSPSLPSLSLFLPHPLSPPLYLLCPCVTQYYKGRKHLALSDKLVLFLPVPFLALSSELPKRFSASFWLYSQGVVFHATGARFTKAFRRKNSS
jgi:hypothetical protein